jgi:hypothetical protein
LEQHIDASAASANREARALDEDPRIEKNALDVARKFAAFGAPVVIAVPRTPIACRPR